MKTLPAMLVPLLLGIAPALAQPSPSAAVPEEVGSWRLACVVDRMTDRADCLLRHRDPVERAASAGGSSLVLEIGRASCRERV